MNTQKRQCAHQAKLVQLSSAACGRLFFILVISSLVLVLSGCGGNQLPDKITTYAERLERVTGQVITLPTPDLQLNYPDITERQVFIPSTTLNLREFYAIKGCAMAPLVAQRNTTLGKVEVVEHRYIYERNMLETLATCGTLIDENNVDLQAELQRLYAHKTATIDAVFVNMIQNSHAMQSGLGFTTRFIGTAQATDEINQTIAALAYLAQLPQHSAVELSVLTAHLQTIEQSEVFARAWRTQRYLAQVLPPITEAVEAYTAGVNCASANEELLIMRNVMTLFFIDQVQPSGSNLQQLAYQTDQHWETIMSNPVAPQFESFILYHIRTSRAAYQTAMENHVKAWQGLFAKCSLSPSTRV
jgi:hypothetical protein